MSATVAAATGLEGRSRTRRPLKVCAWLGGAAVLVLVLAYSVGQQLIVTMWNVGLAVVLVVWAFGWSGGRTLVTDSYEGAKAKVAEQKADRAAKKEAKRS